MQLALYLPTVSSMGIRATSEDSLEWGRSYMQRCTNTLSGENIWQIVLYFSPSQYKLLKAQPEDV